LNGAPDCNLRGLGLQKLREGLSMNVMIGAAVYLILALAVVVGVRGALQKRFLDERAPPPWAGL
jgi:hypothetical protein